MINLDELIAKTIKGEKKFAGLLVACKTNSLPSCPNNTQKVSMGNHGCNFYDPRHEQAVSVWTDKVGPCHAVLIFGRPKPATNIGQIGLAHVTGQHDVIMDAVYELKEKMTMSIDHEIYIVGGDAVSAPTGHTVDKTRIPNDLKKMIKLVVSPTSDGGKFVCIELTSKQKINICRHK